MCGCRLIRRLCLCPDRPGCYWCWATPPVVFCSCIHGASHSPRHRQHRVRARGGDDNWLTTFRQKGETHDSLCAERPLPRSASPPRMAGCGQIHTRPAPAESPRSSGRCQLVSSARPDLRVIRGGQLPSLRSPRPTTSSSNVRMTKTAPPAHRDVMALALTRMTGGEVPIRSPG